MCLDLDESFEILAQELFDLLLAIELMSVRPAGWNPWKSTSKFALSRSHECMDFAFSKEYYCCAGPLTAMTRYFAS